jgi:putative ABC transport system substrate-binding protein
MRRREFITLLGGAVMAWPLAARAQQRTERVRRVGVLMMYPEGDRQGQLRATAFQQTLERQGWTAGRHNPDNAGSALLADATVAAARNLGVEGI